MVEPLLETFRSSDGYRWYYRHYQPEGRARGRMVFVHGIRSHGGWYRRSCTQLANSGFEVLFLDRRGSGLNTAYRGDAPSFRRLLDDVAEFLMQLRQTQPWLPITLAGISWGGKLAVGLPYRRPGLIERVALLCPGLCPKVSPSLMERIQIGRARLRNPGRMFPIPLNDTQLFTADTHGQKFIDEDRHGLREATARFLFNSASFDIYLRRAVRWLRLPSLLMLAERDLIIDNAATRDFLSNVPCLRTIEYAGAHHTLEFEPEGHPFASDLMDFAGQ